MRAVVPFTPPRYGEGKVKNPANRPRPKGARVAGLARRSGFDYSAARRSNDPDEGQC